MKPGKVNKNSIFWIACFMMTGVSAVVLFLLFLYPDLQSITAWSFDWVDALFKGDLYRYYEWQEKNRFGSPHGTIVGNYYPMVVTGIWDIPAYLLYRITGDVGTPTAKYYYWQKLMYVVLLVILIVFIIKIVKIIKMDNAKQDSLLIVLLMIASPSIAFSILYFGQDEIVYLTLFVISLWAFLQGKQRLFFALSVVVFTLCPIMLIPILLIFLMKEKRVGVLLLYGILLMIPTVLFNMVYKNDPIYSSNKISFTEWANQIMSSTGIQLQYGMVPVTGIVMVLLFLYCYTQKSESFAAESMLFYVSLIMILIGFCTNQLWYRYLIASPFLVILVFLEKRNQKMNLFLLWIITVCRGTSQLSDYRMLNPEYLMNNRLAMNLANLFTGGGFMWKESLHNALNYGNRGFDYLFPIIGSICYAALLILVWINRPANEKEYEIYIGEKVSIVGISCCNLVLLIAFFAVGGPGWRWVISG